MVEVEESVFHPQNGGVIVDSGSSFTYLVEPAFKALLAVVSMWRGGDGVGWGGVGGNRNVLSVSAWYRVERIERRGGGLGLCIVRVQISSLGSNSDSGSWSTFVFPILDQWEGSI